MYEGVLEAASSNLRQGAATAFLLGCTKIGRGLKYQEVERVGAVSRVRTENGAELWIASHLVKWGR